nr:unnamed protein product [Spirometra erinaceieuropaei]
MASREASELGRDAAIIIMELNKGLTSANLGEQCKAIAEFPTLILKYPFPMVINSIFLKISELFREGSNYLRLCRLCKLFGSNSCISEKEEILAIFFKLTESCNFVDLLLHPDEATTENDGSLDCVASCIQWVALENTQSPANTNSALVPRALSLACKLAVLIHLRGGDRKLTTGRNSVLQSDSVADFISQTMSSRKAVKEEDQDPQDGELWFLSTMGPSLVELKHMYMNLLRFFRVFPQFAVILRSVGLFEEVVLSSNPRVALLCQFLGFLCESMARSEKEDWLPTVNEILEHFDATPRGVGRCASTDSAPSSTLPAPFVLVFRMARGEPLSVDQRLRLLSCLARATALTEEEEKCLEPWLVYKLACRASLFRQPSLAADIYDQLCSLATTSTSVYWLQGLATLSRSEVNLLTSVSELTTAMESSPALPWLPRLSAALREASDTAFKARKFFLSTGNRAVNWFQTDYLETRAAFLACLSELCLLLFHAGSSPRCARWAFLETVKSSHVVSSESTLATKNPLIVLQTLLPSWNSLLANLSALIQRCIDADLETLRHLKAFLEMVRFFRSTISEFSGNCSSQSNYVGEAENWSGSGGPDERKQYEEITPGPISRLIRRYPVTFEFEEAAIDLQNHPTCPNPCVKHSDQFRQHHDPYHSLTGHTCICNDRQDSRGGGSCIYVIQTLAILPLGLPNVSAVEGRCWSQVAPENKVFLLVCCVYRPSNVNENFDRCLSQAFHAAADLSFNYQLVEGDVNLPEVRWSPPSGRKMFDEVRKAAKFFVVKSLIDRKVAELFKTSVPSIQYLLDCPIPARV